jgi:LAO/AO transport system kinase
MAEAAFLTPALAGLLERFRDGEIPALARAISVVEGERPGFQELLHAVLDRGPSARRVGFTGPPGAGKSSLVATAATAYRGREERVGVVAVDPTSPYSGGALLGDRIRMNDIALDPGIFIRSMATRGSLGGLATTTKEVVDLMDCFGLDRILIETVGVGQTELEVTAAADTVVVVLVPESGDAIQAMKAGLMEIADVFVVNKADRPGAVRLVKELRQALHLRAGTALRGVPAHHGVDLGRVLKSERSTEAPAAAEDGWEVPVHATNALDGTGLDEVLESVERHGAWLASSGRLSERRRARSERRVRDVVGRELRRTAWRSEAVNEMLDAGVDGIARGDETPYSVAAAIVRTLLR